MDNRTMVKRLAHTGLIIVLILSLTGTGYFGVQKIIENPCTTVKTWSLGTIDPRFGILEETVLLYAHDAQEVWNKKYPENTLLQYQTTGGDITLEFIYDERQRTTIQNERLKRSIEEEKSELYGIKQTLEDLKEEHRTLGLRIAERTQKYTSDLAEQNSEVSYWNSKGGAPSGEYQRLQRNLESLETERLSLNAQIIKYNTLGEEIKHYGKDHNEIVGTLNEKIDTLNENAFREFEEGTYDPATKTITIYEYSDATSLRRVLAHEFGHAIGLKHIDDEEGIMYSVNKGKNLSLTEADTAELRKVCRDRSTEDIVEMIKVTRDGISRLVESSLPDISALLK